jgi:hypothetical protein
MRGACSVSSAAAMHGSTVQGGWGRLGRGAAQPGSAGAAARARRQGRGGRAPRGAGSKERAHWQGYEVATAMFQPGMRVFLSGAAVRPARVPVKPHRRSHAPRRPRAAARGRRPAAGGGAGAQPGRVAVQACGCGKGRDGRFARRGRRAALVQCAAAGRRMPRELAGCWGRRAWPRMAALGRRADGHARLHGGAMQRLP